MLTVVIGGLFVTAVFLYPALQLKKRHKWPIIMGILMGLAGLGLVGIAVWAAGLATSITSTLIVGGIALIMLTGLATATFADLSDKKLDYPWNLFMLPSLVAIVLLTGNTTVAFLAQQLHSNADTISSKIGAR